MDSFCRPDAALNRPHYCMFCVSRLGLSTSFLIHSVHGIGSSCNTLGASDGDVACLGAWAVFDLFSS